MMSSIDPQILRTLQDELIKGLSVSRDVFRTPYSVTLFHPHDALCWINQTLPIGPIGPDEIAELEAEHGKRGRGLCFEYVHEQWPELEELLLDQGFERKLEGSLMVHERESIVDHEPAIFAERGHFPEFWEAGSAAFGHPTSQSDSQAVIEAKIEAHLEGVRQKNRWAALRMEDGLIVSVGQIVGTLLAAEVAGVGTLEAYRGRGHARSVVSTLLARYYADGGQTAWLTTEPHNTALYRKCGFSEAGRMLGLVKTQAR